MKTDCPSCSRKKSVSEGPYHGRWYRKCHGCGWIHSDEWAPQLPRSPQELLNLLGKGNHPTGAIQEPTEAMLAWLGRYGVTWAQFQRFGGFAAEGRLVFRCDSFDALRNAGDVSGPKWLTRIKEPFMGFDKGFHWGWGDADTIVITEDSMAALKAAIAGLQGFPMLGTNSNRLVPAWFAGKKVRVLTDPDDAGRLAGRRLLFRLRGLDVKVLNGKEPKEYTFEELRTLCT